MAAPRHIVHLLPLPLQRTTSSDRELKALTDDYRNADYGPLPDYAPGSIDLSEDVVRIQTSKTLDLNRAGTFELTLIDRRRFGLAWGSSEPKVSYTVNVQPNDIIRISLNRGLPSDDFEHVTIGVVERVFKRTAVGNNSTSHYVGISGFDLTHWLQRHRNFFWLYAVGNDPKSGVIEVARRVHSNAKFMKDLFPGGGEALPADKLIERIFKERPTHPSDEHGPQPGYIAAQFPRVDERFIYNPMGTRSKKARDAGLMEDQGGSLFGFGERYVPHETLDAFQGAVLNILDAYSFAPFCEMWCDVDDLERFSLNHRRCPFDREDWDALKTHVVDDSIIVRMDLGRSLHDAVNFVSVVPRTFGAREQDLLRLFMKSTLRMDWSRIRDVGVRPKFITPRYLDGYVPGTRRRLAQEDREVELFKQGKGTLARLASNWAQVYWDWHSEHARYWAGRVTFQGTPGIRVGQRVYLPGSSRKHFDQTMALYVVGVSHSYDIQDKYLTTILVTRGQPADAFIEPVTDGRKDRLKGEVEKNRGQVSGNPGA